MSHSYHEDYHTEEHAIYTLPTSPRIQSVRVSKKNKVVLFGILTLCTAIVLLCVIYIVSFASPVITHTSPHSTYTVPLTHTAVRNSYRDNIWGYNFVKGSLITVPPVGFCSFFSCTANFTKQHGYIIQCQDGKFSHAGGEATVCASYGGPGKILYSH